MSISQLRELGRKIEARKVPVENFIALTTKLSLLKPDLAYVYVEIEVVAIVGTSASMYSYNANVSRYMPTNSKMLYATSVSNSDIRPLDMLKRLEFFYRCRKKVFTLWNWNCYNCSKQKNEVRFIALCIRSCLQQRTRLFKSGYVGKKRTGITRFRSLQYNIGNKRVRPNKINTGRVSREDLLKIEVKVVLEVSHTPI